MIPRWISAVQIPKPYREYCSKHILVMEYLEGIKLVDGIRSKFKKIAALSGRTLEEIEEERKELIASGKYHFKSIEQAKVDRQHLKRMLLINDITKFSNIWKLMFNYSLAGWIYGPYELDWTELPVDLGATIELLCHIHANQVFEHGKLD